jgi:predicted ribosomally synthesized peptide with SipW-like signal peptide
MFKRLSISLLLMGLAAFSLGAAAFAWFSDSETGNVTIQTGTAGISIAADQDCDNDDIVIVNEAPVPLIWSGIVPGQATSDCFVVTNSGDGSLDVFVKHQNFSGNAALRGAVVFTYDTDGDGGNPPLCGPALTEDFGFTGNNSERGCFLGTIAEDATLEFQARVLFPESGGDQNSLQNRSFGMNAVVTGYTGP